MNKFTILFLTFLAFNVNAANYPCSEQDKMILESVIKRHIDLHSTVSSRDVTLQFIGCQLNYAKIIITPHKPITDAATSYWHKVNDKWELVAFGTNFDEQVLRQIPSGIK